MNARVHAAIALLALLSCAPDTITRTEWQQMPSEDRMIYVQSLIGAERTKQAKGGGGRNFGRPPADYVAAIDAAYARGDQRPPEEIFAELGE